MKPRRVITAREQVQMLTPWRVAAEQSLVLYHGTGERSVDHITQNGLMPPPNVNSAGWPMLTTDFNQAVNYAQSDNPVVAEYHIPAHRTYGRWRHDDTNTDEPLLWDAQPHMDSSYPGAQSYAVKSPIPAEFLHRIHRGVQPQGHRTASLAPWRVAAWQRPR